MVVSSKGISKMGRKKVLENSVFPTLLFTKVFTRTTRRSVNQL